MQLLVNINVYMSSALGGPENLRPFHNFSTFYSAKYVNSLYNSIVNCPKGNTFSGHFFKKISQADGLE